MPNIIQNECRLELLIIDRLKPVSSHPLYVTLEQRDTGTRPPSFSAIKFVHVRHTSAAGMAASGGLVNATFISCVGFSLLLAKKLCSQQQIPR